MNQSSARSKGPVIARSTPRRSTGHRIGRLAWFLWALTVVLTAFGLLLTLNLWYQDVQFNYYWALSSVLPPAVATVGLVIASHRPHNYIGLIFCTIGALTSAQIFCALYAVNSLLVVPDILSGGEALAWATSWLGYLWIGLAALFALLFPNGRLLSDRWRWVAWSCVVTAATGAVVTAFLPGPIEGIAPIRNPLGIERIDASYARAADIFLESCISIVSIVAWTSPIVRLRQARGQERQQLKWCVYAAALGVGTRVIAGTLFEIFPVPPGVYWTVITVSTLAIIGFPVAVGFAVLKYHLYDIDIVINRTLVYGALTVSVVSLYVLVVMGVGALVQTRGNFVPSLAAVGLVAVVFQPLRHRLQQAVNHLMYGERDEPRAVLSRLGKALEGSLASRAVLPAVCKTVAQALKLPFVAVDLGGGGKLQRIASHGTPAEEVHTLPLIYQNEVVGELLFSPRRGEQLNARDLELLEDVCRHAAVAAHDVSLAADLQRSREELVTTREEERRRIRRDLHDGLGPSLATLTLKLDAARNLLSSDPQLAERLLLQLKENTQDAIADIRQLVYELRPPALDELGLVGAIREQAAQYSSAGNRSVAGIDAGLFCCTVEAPARLEGLPAAVEVAAYRIVQEALTNAARHSGAKNCHVRLSLGDASPESGYLQSEITDDGTGLPEGYRAGVGTTSMRERAEELGGKISIENLSTGGTKVYAVLPLPRKEEGGDEREGERKSTRHHG